MSSKDDPTFGLPPLPPRPTAWLLRLFFAWHKLLHFLGGLFRPRVRSLDHVTVPCYDLAVAEQFYAGILGGRVMLRIDEGFLERMGRPADEISRGRHLSIVFDSGPRLDLFQSREGQPPPLSDHPHVAFTVTPRAMRRFQERLHAAGVRTEGPRRLGPRGQASLYFNDPFGNHLELTAIGFPGELPVGAPNMARLWPEAPAATAPNPAATAGYEGSGANKNDHGVSANT